MKFAVIAAGEGSRLSQEGVGVPKPLVKVCGEPMIDRLLRIFVDCGATEIVVVVNEQSVTVREHLEAVSLPVPLRLVVKTTPSSMHSFHAISSYLRGGRFCLTTVDTIFREQDFKKYITYFEHTPDIDGCMAVTPYVDDEKPLWVSVSEEAPSQSALPSADSGRLFISGFHDSQEQGDCFVSGGIYCLADRALDVLDSCMERGMSRMRNFQRQLVSECLCLEAYPITKILDVDHKDDIAKAESFLHPLAGKRILGICRGSEFSPNCVDKDMAVMRAVSRNLEALGAEVSLLNESVFRTVQFEDFDASSGKKADAVFSMARSRAALAVLASMERSGCAVVNPSHGVERCVRTTMSELFSAAGIRSAQSRIIRRGGSMIRGISYPCWLKRGDACAQSKEDTCHVSTEAEAQSVLASYWRRSVESVVVNEHLTGDLVKFYGIYGSRFFFWLYPSRSVHHSKFGLEAINGEAKGFAFDADCLKREADRAARVLGISVYGGDCVVASDGSFSIIDFNDWPSFAPCLEDAAYEIAMKIMNEVSSHR